MHDRIRAKEKMSTEDRQTAVSVYDCNKTIVSLFSLSCL